LAPVAGNAHGSAADKGFKEKKRLERFNNVSLAAAYILFGFDGCAGGPRWIFARAIKKVIVRGFGSQNRMSLNFSSC